MGFVRKESYLHKTGGYLYPTNILIYKIAVYLPERNEYLRFWNPMTDDLMAKDWILVKPKKVFSRAYSSDELKEMELDGIVSGKEKRNEIQYRNKDIAKCSE